MSSVIGVDGFAVMWPNILACGAKSGNAGKNAAKGTSLGAGALLIALLSASAAQAQCAAVGFNPPPGFPTGPTVTAVAGVSAYVGTLAASIHSANTAFLSQSTAFIGSPPNPAPDQESGGVWARGVGGHLSFGTTATAGNINFGGSVPGNVVCNTRTLADFAGVQLGTDIARLNVNGWNVHAGSTIGDLGSKTRDATPSGLNPPASFHDSLQIPFAGAYIAASNGGFLVDAQLRGMFFQNDVSDSNHGMAGQRFDARGVSLTGNVGYNYNLGNRWFVEPSAGIIWSRTQVDPMNVPGTFVTGTGGVPPWVLTVNDIESTLGRLTARVGTSFTSDNVMLQPFVSASVFHEFQGGLSSSLTSNFSAVGLPGVPTLSSTVSVTDPRTYGQFGLGLATQSLDSRWVSYLRGDYRTGDHIEGWSLNGGVRYQFVPERWQPVIAKAPVYKSPEGPAVYQWTGFFLGGHLGAGWGSTSWALDGFDETDMHAAGFLGGGDIGFNYQVGQWVFGVEGSGSRTNIRAVAPCANGFFYNCEAEMNWLSMVTGRIGYAYWDRLLLFAKGGVAIARDRDTVACNTGSQPTVVSVVGCPSRTDANTKAGWTIGWGSEFGLTQNVSVSGQISYFNLGSEHADSAGVPAEIQRDGFISTMGLHFRFGG
jgi:outer membrane autotransporter protein